MIIDILIVLVVIGAAWLGFQRGLVQPLLTEVFALGTLLLILHNRGAFLAAAGDLFHANAVLAVFMAVVLAVLMGVAGARLGGAVHRMPVVRGLDGFLGIWFQTLVGIVLVYVAISGIVAMNRAFAPIRTAQSVNQSQLRLIQRELDANPLTSALVDTSQLNGLLGRATKPGGVRVADLPTTQVQAIYQDLLLPQLTSSRLSPMVMRVGEHMPGIGRFGPGDLPRKSTSRT